MMTSPSLIERHWRIGLSQVAIVRFWELFSLPSLILGFVYRLFGGEQTNDQLP
jgi:hypothetical protein